MDMLNSLLRIAMIFLLFRAIFSIASGISMSKKMKRAQQNSDKINQALAEQRGRQQNELLNQMVRDDYCGKLVEKSKAYIIRSDDNLHHFCSWECRQNYIQETAHVQEAT